MNEGGQWIVLRTASTQTVPLVRSLQSAGFEAWSPVKTIMRPIPGQRRAAYMGTRRKMREVETAILPGFVFADARSLVDVAAIALEPFNQHPGFTILHTAGRAPIIAERSLHGLREAERIAAEIAAENRDAQSRQEARKLRAERMRTERARRKALRSERRDFKIGDAVTVLNMPAMQGMVGSVVKSTGKAAIVSFGGAVEFEVEAWQLVPNALMESAA